MLHNGKAERIRLHGIDCPEKRQAFGNRAKQFISTLVFGKTVTVQVLDRDCYGRTAGDVTLPDGRVLDEERVKAANMLSHCISEKCLIASSTAPTASSR